MADSKAINRAIAIQKGWSAKECFSWDTDGSGNRYKEIYFEVYDPDGEYVDVPIREEYSSESALDSVIPQYKLEVARQIVEREYCSTSGMADDQVLGIMREHGWHWNDQGWVSVDAGGVWFVQRLIPDWGQDERE